MRMLQCVHFLSALDVSSLKRTNNHTKGFSLLLTGVEKSFVKHRSLPTGGDTHQVSNQPAQPSGEERLSMGSFLHRRELNLMCWITIMNKNNQLIKIE